MTEDRTSSSGEDTSAQARKAGRDARGRWKPGHCPNPKGRPKKKRFKDYNPSDPRHFFNTQIEVMTADGAQKMDRKAALMHKVFENAMKGGVTAQRMVFEMIEQSDLQLAEMKLRYERLESELIHENPDFKSIDESLTLKQRTELLGLAAALEHYYPGQYAAVLGDYTDPEVNNRFEEVCARFFREKGKTQRGDEEAATADADAKTKPESEE